MIITTQKEDAITELLENFDIDSDVSSEEIEEEEGEKEEEEQENGVETAAERNGEGTGSKDQTNNLELLTEVMVLKGSSYRLRFQKHLKSCKELLIKNESPALRFHFEPANRRDENAIIVQAELVQATGVKEWQPIGYIPGQKVPKVTLAIRNNDIQMVTLKNVFYPAIQIFSINCSN